MISWFGKKNYSFIVATILYILSEWDEVLDSFVNTCQRVEKENLNPFYCDLPTYTNRFTSWFCPVLKFRQVLSNINF